MGFLDKLKELTRPFPEDEDEDEAYEESTFPHAAAVPQEPQITPAPRTPSASSAYSEFAGRPVPGTPPRVPSAASGSDKVVNIHATAQLQVVLVKPEQFESAAEIADNLRDKRTVVMNLEKTQKEIARRLIDFLSGVAYAYNGQIKRIAVSTYIITPYNVDIMGDLIDELENNGLYL